MIKSKRTRKFIIEPVLFQKAPQFIPQRDESSFKAIVFFHLSPFLFARLTSGIVSFKLKARTYALKDVAQFPRFGLGCTGFNGFIECCVLNAVRAYVAVIGVHCTPPFDPCLWQGSFFKLFVKSPCTASRWLVSHGKPLSGPE